MGATIIKATEADLVNEGLRSKGVLPQQTQQRVEVPAPVVAAIRITAQAELLAAMARDVAALATLAVKAAVAVRTNAPGRTLRAQDAATKAADVLARMKAGIDKARVDLAALGVELRALEVPEAEVPAEDGEPVGVVGAEDGACAGV